MATKTELDNQIYELQNEVKKLKQINLVRGTKWLVDTADLFLRAARKVAESEPNDDEVSAVHPAAEGDET